MASSPADQTSSLCKLNTIEEALESFRNGECLVVVDDLERENEGDLVVAAAKITTEMMAWIIKHSR
jgi:3,4-dihydroxy 2-butanone 4-phosphate synthase